MDNFFEILKETIHKKNSIVIDGADEILTDGKKVEIFLKQLVLKDSLGDKLSQYLVNWLNILIEFNGSFEFDFETKRYKITIFDTKGVKFYTAKEVEQNERT